MSVLEIKRVAIEMQSGLMTFFDVIKEDKESKHFHPHPFTAEYANRIASYSGQDLYYVIQTHPEMIVGYGMLRGWDEGYTIPGLGIIIHPRKRGTGLGQLMMKFLEQSARERLAPKIRLKVYPDNVVARHVYQKLGYIFEDEMIDGQLVGFKTLQ